RTTRPAASTTRRPLERSTRTCTRTRRMMRTERDWRTHPTCPSGSVDESTPSQGPRRRTTGSRSSEPNSVRLTSRRTTGPAAFGAVQGSLRVERTNRLPHDLRRHAGRGSESWHGRSPALDRLRRSSRRTPRFSPAVQRTLFLILADAKRRPSSDLRVRVYVTNASAGGLTLLDLGDRTRHRRRRVIDALREAARQRRA